jgi:streptomycin 6-kinase
MQLRVPERLAANAATEAFGRRWLAELPSLVESLCAGWSLTVAAPFETEVSCSWVAPAVRRDGTPAVLKIQLPHLEAAHEIAGLRIWNGDATVRLLEADDARSAMLLERCTPGTPLRRLPEPEQDVVLAAILRRMWRAVPAPSPFRSLAEMTAHWIERESADLARSPDPGLVRAGRHLYAELPRSAPANVLLATDLHAGNVLAAEREPWLAIDPKPFVGDPAYDATQHLVNCDERMRAEPLATIERFAGLLAVDAERLRLWMFARAATRCLDAEGDARWGPIARALG